MAASMERAKLNSRAGARDAIQRVAMDFLPALFPGSLSSGLALQLSWDSSDHGRVTAGASEKPSVPWS